MAGHENMDQEMQISNFNSRIPTIEQLRAVRPIKNLLVLCTSFLLLFVAYFGSVNLLSSLNIEAGLGMASQSILFGSYMISSMILPPSLIRKFGLKTTMVLSLSLYSPYIAANFYPSWATFVPSAILLGVAGGPLWSSTLPYVNRLAEIYSPTIGKSRETCVYIFIGVFYTFYGSCNIWGNLISYFILTPSMDSVVNDTKEYSNVCGINFCDWYAEVDRDILQPPEHYRVVELTAVFTVLAVLSALLMVFFLDPVFYGQEDNETVWQLITEPVKRLLIPYHLLLIPITIYSGFEMSFMTAEFTKAYIACTQGISEIGLTVMVFGVTSTASALALGLASGRLHPVVTFCLATGINVVALTLLWRWEPQHGQRGFLFAISAVWGIADAVWQSQLRGVYGVLFPSNHRSAYSLHSFFEGLGFLIAFAYSSHLCLETKVYVMICTLATGMVGYLTVEVHRRKRARVNPVFS